MAIENDGRRFGRLNVWAMLSALTNKRIGFFVNAGAPTDGTSGTGVNKAGIGTLLWDYTNKDLYINVGTLASPTWQMMNPDAFAGDVTISGAGVTAIGASKVLSAMLDPTLLRTVTGIITAANIIGTSPGQLGHANGVILVPAAATGYINELVSAVLINAYAVAAYTGGGNTTINIGGGGAALSGLISNANFIQAAANKIIQFAPLAAVPNVYTDANSINLVTASAPTNPGTAAGVFRYKVVYRVWPTGL